MAQGSAGGRTERGSTLLEFALVIIVLLTMMFGIIDFARALYAYHFVANAAREGSRYASVRGSTWIINPCVNFSSAGCSADNSNVQAFVANLATGIGLGDTGSSAVLTANLGSANPPNGRTDCVGAAPIPPGCVAVVEVDYGFSFILPFLPNRVCTYAAPSGEIMGSICMTSTSQMVVTQ
jgi:Flp pilus assembly protein TadG